MFGHDDRLHEARMAKKMEPPFQALHEGWHVMLDTGTRAEMLRRGAN